jgi:hypothetical protein
MKQVELHRQVKGWQSAAAAARWRRAQLTGPILPNAGALGGVTDMQPTGNPQTKRAAGTDCLPRVSRMLQ